MCQEELMEAYGNLWGQCFEICFKKPGIDETISSNMCVNISKPSTHFFVHVWYAKELQFGITISLLAIKGNHPSFPRWRQARLMLSKETGLREEMEATCVMDGPWGCGGETFLFKLSKWEKHEKICTPQDLQGGVGIVSVRKKYFNGMIFNFSVFARQSCFVVLMKKGLPRRTRLGFLPGDCV